MPTKKQRYMIVLDDKTNKQLQKIMKSIKTKQRSKAIKYAILLTDITLLFSTKEQIKYLDKQRKEIIENL